MERLLYGGFCRSLDLFFLQILTSFDELKNLCLTIEAGTLRTWTMMREFQIVGSLCLVAFVGIHEARERARLKRID